MNKRTFIALAIIFTGASVFLFNSFYKEPRKTAFTKLNEEQTIHARQAAQRIEDFFAMWTRSLNSLSKMDEIIVVSRDGTQLYSPIPGFTGRSVFENIKDSPFAYCHGERYAQGP